jgi:hypothetical protein
MKCLGLGIILIVLGVLGVRTDAHATGRLADVQIIDRETGSVLPMYRSHGEYWVAGRPGARYSIMIQNHRGERVLAVTAVDGINVISGETGAWSQSGYVFSPGESYEIAGWRKSNAEIAAFNFTAADNSYAERTGRPANIGVIGVALFLERPARIQWLDRLSSDRKSEGSGYAQNRVESAGVSDSRAAPPSFIGGAPVAPKLAEIEPYAAAPNPSPAQKLARGTAHVKPRMCRIRPLIVYRARPMNSSRFATIATRIWWQWALCPPGRRGDLILSPIHLCRGMYRTRRAADNGVNGPGAGE